MIHPIIDEIINGETCVDVNVSTRLAKNERQLAETVRNTLRNLLEATDSNWSRKNTITGLVDLVNVRMCDLEEMYADMVQLNELRLKNKTW
jgi:acetyl-CoA carboxylase alpha subunit